MSIIFLIFMRLRNTTIRRVVAPDVRDNGEVPFGIDSFCPTRVADDLCHERFYCNRFAMNVDSIACSDLSAQAY